MDHNPFEGFTSEEMETWWQRFFDHLIEHDLYTCCRLLFPELDEVDTDLMVETELQGKSKAQFVGWCDARLTMADKQWERTRETN